MPFDVLAYANSHVLTGVNANDAILGGLDLPLRVDSDQLIGDTVVTEVISGVVDLDLIFRHVEMPNLVSKVPAAAWPHDAVAQQTVVPGGGTVPEVNVIVNSGLAAAPANGGVEAWAGNTAGTIPLGFREVVNPPRVEYRWLFTDAEGERLSAEEFTVSAGSLQSAALSVAFRPDVVEWPSGVTDVGGLEPTRVIGVQVEVRVRLEQTGQDSGWIAIPGDPIPVGILPLPLPVVAAMFRNPSFGGDSVLLMVPADSPFDSAGEVVDAVAVVAALAGRLQAAGSLAAWAAGIAVSLPRYRSLPTGSRPTSTSAGGSRTSSMIWASTTSFPSTGGGTLISRIEQAAFWSSRRHARSRSTSTTIKAANN